MTLASLYQKGHSATELPGTWSVTDAQHCQRRERNQRGERDGSVRENDPDEAAFLVERLQARAAHAGEVEALKLARDALLTIVAEGYQTLGDRLRRPVGEPRVA